MHDRLALVTGAAGFIGSHLVERLAREGWRVRGLDIRQPTGSWVDALDGDRVKFTTGDIRDADLLARLAEGVDVVFHQAAISSVQRSVENPRETVDVNIGGTLNVLEAARVNGCRVVFASSAAIYGDALETPKTEAMLPRPLTPYAVSKLSGEHLCASYGHVYGVETVALRYFNVYGPRQDPSSPYSGVISRFVDAVGQGRPVTIFGDGEQTRDFVSVSDVVNANLQAACAREASGRAFNIGSGAATSLNELLAIIGRLANSIPVVDAHPARAGDIRDSLASIASARAVLGYSPSTPLELGLAAMVDGA
ncbi:MAG: SDR family NAD(P)-dependent oxidoreductase [Thermomicrobiales bacterium]|nr:SDR family NAD(P)-dependent oxidoreductase [Thermomicrobiales bacterium]